MSDQSHQLSSFLQNYGNKTNHTVSFGDTTNLGGGGGSVGGFFPRTSSSSISSSNPFGALDTKSLMSGVGNSPNMQIDHLNSILKMKTQQIDRLQAEVRTLIRIQNEQAAQLLKTLEERQQLEKQLAATSKILSSRKADVENNDRPYTAELVPGETPYFIQNSVFLRVFLRNDQKALEDLITSIGSIEDQHTRGQAAQALLTQTQRFLELNTVFERLCDENGMETFVPTFEQNVRNLMDSRRVILWARIPSSRVIVSKSASTLVPEGEGLLGHVVQNAKRAIISDPTKEIEYSPEYDAAFVATAKVVLYQPVTNSKNEVIWVIQMIDRLDQSGTVVSPSNDDILIIDFLTTSLQRLYQEESRYDEMIKKILTESTKSLLNERQVMPLLETVQLTVTRIIGCEVLQIFFADPAQNYLFQLKEAANTNNDPNNDVDLSSVTRYEVSIDNAGIAGVAYRLKKTINLGIAKEHNGYNATVDGEYPNGSLLAVPLVSSKGIVTLVAVARQKRSGMMFTSSDEIILEALSRVSSGALSNAQSHERNIAEIKKALSNHKYYTALLAVAQELSSVLDTNTLVRKIMTKAQTFIGADRCSLFLVDKIRGGLWSIVAHGATDRIHIPEGEGIAGYVAQSGETLNIPDAYNDPRFNSAVDKQTGYRTRSILCVPIKNNDGTIIGCTQMINKLGATEFVQTDVELMSAFNVFCGIALSNAQLYESATQSKKKMTAMLDIALNLSTTTTFNALIGNITSKAKELLEAEYCYVFIIDRARHICRPLATNSEQTIEFSTRRDAVGFVATTGAEVNVSDPQNDKRFDLFFCEHVKIQPSSILVMPVIDASSQVVGVMLAINKNGMPKFTEEDQSLLRAFSSFTGLALDRWMMRKPGDFWQSEVDLLDSLASSDLSSSSVPEKMKIYEPLSSTVSSQSFDVLQFPRNEQFRIIVHFFDDLNLMSEFDINIGTLLHFLNAASSEYHHVPYHNWNHAMDVTQYVFFQINIGRLSTQLTKMELLALLVTGICHDMGHSGRSNTFNVKAQTPLSLLYKDQPVMETFHCSSAIKTMAKPNCNILAGLDNTQLHDFWVLVIDCILATDMSQHQKIIEEVAKRTGEGKFDLTNPQNRASLMKLVIKIADLSNLSRPFDTASPWANTLVEECFSQGDEEQKLGIGFTSPMNDRNSLELAKSQIYFSTTYGQPMVNAAVRAVPLFKPIEDQFLDNLQRWRDFLLEHK
ncbi:GAF domain containing protein [Tritrichomonas foetus]|uniref:Phosphodiesterase n=1 Tax=Tritrichomonas foetus TaxID=1144522 RepID=A0A1J4JKL5_9EUKA|nr:GAF domain containing protein [Tritrichomonas foetus]|eukprot:OHS99654.1 GAF domain containing protein [Tritrichomonas foetus]